MAIFNREYLEEVYKSKYAEFLDDDDDEQDDDDKPKDEPNKAPTTPEHLSKEEIRKIMTIVTSKLMDYPKLKKCCDYIDLSDKDKINDDGERESSYDEYYNNGAKSFIKLIDGDVFSGYPDFRSRGNEAYEKDSKEFVKSVNELLDERGIKAKFSIGSDKEDEAISFGVKSTKEK